MCINDTIFVSLMNDRYMILCPAFSCIVSFDGIIGIFGIKVLLPQQKFYRLTVDIRNSEKFLYLIHSLNQEHF
jgi:hypothetical protein